MKLTKHRKKQIIMSTYFKHFGNVNIKEVVEKTNWEIGIKEELIDVNTAIDEQYFYINNGKDCLWLDTDSIGNIISFTSYGGNDADFLIDLIGNTVSEYEFREGKINYYDDDELREWLFDNTYFNKYDNQYLISY